MNTFRNSSLAARHVAAVSMLAVLLTLPQEGATQQWLDAGTAVSPGRLDALRGGFNLNSLMMSIGIARVVYVNGEPVVTTTLNIPALDATLNSRASATVSQQVHPSFTREVRPGNNRVERNSGGHHFFTPVVVLDAKGASLIQNGPGNTAMLPQGLPSAAVIVQNTLDNQSIRSLTTINAKVSAASIMEGMNMAASMGAALRPSIR